MFAAWTGSVGDDDNIKRFLGWHHSSSLRKVAYLMQFGIPIRVHVLFFTNNIRGHRFKTIRLAVFFFPFKGASVELLHLQCYQFQFDEATKRPFVEMIHAAPRLLPCEVCEQAISAGVVSAHTSAVRVNIGFFAASETRRTHSSSPSLKRARYSSCFFLSSSIAWESSGW